MSIEPMRNARVKLGVVPSRVVTRTCGATAASRASAMGRITAPALRNNPSRTTFAGEHRRSGHVLPRRPTPESFGHNATVSVRAE